MIKVDAIWELPKGEQIIVDLKEHDRIVQRLSNELSLDAQGIELLLSVEEAEALAQHLLNCTQEIRGMDEKIEEYNDGFQHFFDPYYPRK